MTCVELHQSLAEQEDVGSWEQRTHLRECPACSTLVRELNLIVAAAGQLQEADEPSPRVWNSIEAVFVWRAMGRGALAGAGGGDVVAGFGNLYATGVPGGPCSAAGSCDLDGEPGSESV